MREARALYLYTGMHTGHARCMCANRAALRSMQHSTKVQRRGGKLRRPIRKRHYPSGLPRLCQTV
jgi:hypothetical protein